MPSASFQVTWPGCTYPPLTTTSASIQRMSCSTCSGVRNFATVLEERGGSILASGFCLRSPSLPLQRCPSEVAVIPRACGFGSRSPVCGDTGEPHRPRGAPKPRQRAFDAKPEGLAHPVLGDAAVATGLTPSDVIDLAQTAVRAVAVRSLRSRSWAW